MQLPGREGYLGILPGHTPLLTELGIGALSYRKGSADAFTSPSPAALRKCWPERVTVLADVAERADEIDVARARAALAEAEKKLVERRGIRRDRLGCRAASRGTRADPARVAGHAAQGASSRSRRTLNPARWIRFAFTHVLVPGLPLDQAVPARARHPYEEINVDEDPDAEDLILRVNDGRRKVPTLEVGGRYFACSPFDPEQLAAELKIPLNP